MKLTHEDIAYINTLEKISGVKAVDCIVREKEVVFVIMENQMGKAIGKNGEKLKKIREKLRKKIVFFEEGNNEREFIEKAFRKFKVEDITLTELDGRKSIVVELGAEAKMKILNDAGRIRNMKEVLRKEYNIHELRIK